MLLDKNLETLEYLKVFITSSIFYDPRTFETTNLGALRRQIISEFCLLQRNEDGSPLMTLKEVEELIRDYFLVGQHKGIFLQREFSRLITAKSL